MTLDILYFAWLRERIGAPRERVETSAETVRELVAELIARGERHAAALSDLGAVRVAVDQVLSDLDAPWGCARGGVLPADDGG